MWGNLVYGKWEKEGQFKKKGLEKLVTIWGKNWEFPHRWTGTMNVKGKRIKLLE